MRKMAKLNVIASPLTVECFDHNCDVTLEFILMWLESDLVVLYSYMSGNIAKK